MKYAAQNQNAVDIAAHILSNKMSPLARGTMEAITGRDDQAIISEVERGEDYIKAKFDTAMKDDELMPETRGLLQQCYESIRKGHDRASAMKHANT